MSPLPVFTCVRLSDVDETLAAIARSGTKVLSGVRLNRGFSSDVEGGCCLVLVVSDKGRSWMKLNVTCCTITKYSGSATS